MSMSQSDLEITLDNWAEEWAKLIKDEEDFVIASSLTGDYDEEWAYNLVQTRIFLEAERDKLNS